MPGSSTIFGGTSEWIVFADQGVFGTVFARGCASPRLPQSLHLLTESVVDALERDLSHPSHEAEDISVGDVRDCTGVAVVQRAVDAQSHQCARVAEFAEAQTRRPSRRLVLVETQHDDGVEPDSDTDSVVYAWEDDHDEDPAQEDGVAVNRVDHNHDDPPFPEVRPAVLPAVIPNMVLSESANSMSDSEGPSEDVGPFGSGEF